MRTPARREYVRIYCPRTAGLLLSVPLFAASMGLGVEKITYECSGPAAHKIKAHKVYFSINHNYYISIIPRRLCESEFNIIYKYIIGEGEKRREEEKRGEKLYLNKSRVFSQCA